MNDAILVYWHYLTASPQASMFAISLAILAVAMTVKIYRRAFKLKFLDKTNLQTIEFDEIHIASLHELTFTLLTFVILLIAATDILTTSATLPLIYSSLPTIAVTALALAYYMLLELSKNPHPVAVRFFVLGALIVFIPVIFNSFEAAALNDNLVRISFLIAALIFSWQVKSKITWGIALLTVVISICVWSGAQLVTQVL